MTIAKDRVKLILIERVVVLIVIAFIYYNYDSLDL